MIETVGGVTSVFGLKTCRELAVDGIVLELPLALVATRTKVPAGPAPTLRLKVAAVPVVLIEAEDAGALRAAVNSYLRWADVAAGVVKEARP